MNGRRLLLALLVTIGGALSYGLSIADSDDEKEGREKTVSLKEVPNAVKATMLAELLREVDGLKLEELEREREGGKTVYEAEFEYRDKDIVLEIAADGKLLEKAVERDDDDDEDDDDDDDDE